MENKSNLFGSNQHTEVYTAEENLIDFYIDSFLYITAGIRDECILKGNVLLNKLAPNYARATKDLDMSVMSDILYNSTIKPRLVAWATQLCENHLASSYAVKDISSNRSGGVVLYGSSGEVVFSVDVSLYTQSVIGLVDYSFGTATLKGVTVDKIICDKVLTTLSRKRFRRVKDFYDLYVIKQAGLKYDINKVCQLMLQKESEECIKEYLLSYPFSPAVIENLVLAWDKFQLTSFTKNMQLRKPTIYEVIDSASSFYELCQLYFHS